MRFDSTINWDNCNKMLNTCCYIFLWLGKLLRAWNVMSMTNLRFTKVCYENHFGSIIIERVGLFTIYNLSDSMILFHFMDSGAVINQTQVRPNRLWLLNHLSYRPLPYIFANDNSLYNRKWNLALFWFHDHLKGLESFT